MNTWARATDGSTNIFPSESGMVGVPNSRAVWATFVPPETVRYDAEYGGKTISVANLGNGKYELTVNGVTTIREYNSRWFAAPFFDAAGGPVVSIESASVPGNPATIYSTPGRLLETAPTVTTGAAPTQPPQSVQWTRGSDGSDAVWCGESGMVAAVNSRGFWCAWKPAIGVTYQSHYGGDTIAVRNENNANYSFVQDNGNPTIRVYASRWRAGAWYDAAGNEVNSFESAAVPGDPQAMYYAVGAVYTPAAVPSTPTTPTGAPVTPVTPATPAGGSVILPPAAVTPGTPASPATPATPRPVTTVPTPGQSSGPPVVVVGFPEGAQAPGAGEQPGHSSGTGKVIALAVAGYLLFS